MVHDPETTDAVQGCCRNCGISLMGGFCHQCGQKHINGRLNTKALFAQFFEALTESDSTLWQTLKKLARNPGAVALEYIEGGRAQYLNPVRFVLVTFTLYLGLMVLSGAQFDIANRAYIPSEADALDSTAQAFDRALTSIISSQMNLVILIVIPVLALFIRWQHWRSERNYAETFTFICFVFGLGFLYGSLVVPTLYFTDTYSSVPKNLITLALFILGAKTFFNISWMKAIVTSLFSALAYLFAVSGVTTIIAIAVILFNEL